MKYSSIIGLLLLCSMWCACSDGYRYESGTIFGTFYHLTYQYPESLQSQVEEALQGVDGSLSTFNDHSVISRVNRNEEVMVDSLFIHLFEIAARVNEESEGAFDLTVLPMVEAWRNAEAVPSASVLDSLRALVGMSRWRLEEGRVRKPDSLQRIDAASIAKGLGVDVAAELLEACGVENYMVEIGGEIRIHGVNPKHRPWVIGIARPDSDRSSSYGALYSTIAMMKREGAVATSGNYKNYRVIDGTEYGHIIDPRTGMPASHALKSVTVVAPSCMEADAYATAFMVMGKEKSLALAETLPDIYLYLLVEEDDVLAEYTSSGFQNPDLVEIKR